MLPWMQPARPHVSLGREFQQVYSTSLFNGPFVEKLRFVYGPFVEKYRQTKHYLNKPIIWQDFGETKATDRNSAKILQKKKSVVEREGLRRKKIF